jgi:16S rRNA (cytosine1402-N4)-methyltransferase
MAESRPPRRKRYAGTHPRRFEERYKELDAARFPDEAGKIRAQGRTPAGTHVPVMLKEVLAALDPQNWQTFLDCTLGYGGHAEAIAPRVARTIALDVDAEEQARTVARLAARGISIAAHHANFAGIAKVLKAENLQCVDLLLADLGVSSMQLDRPERGFSYKNSGPLDMRMDRSKGQTAAELLKTLSVKDLAKLLHDYGDEPHAEKIATALKAEPPKSANELTVLVLRTKGMAPRHRQKSAADTHPAARVFQALRMAVNHETENLEALLRNLPYVLNPGGRAAIITFHSGEENRVREALTAGQAEGLYEKSDLAGATPTREELYDNARARSAKLFMVKRV